jgi:hypothetical protein
LAPTPGEETPAPTPTGQPPSTPSAEPTPSNTPSSADCAGVVGGAAVLDQCGVCNGNGSSCLGCTTTDVTDIQIRADSSGFRQLRLIRRARLLVFNTTKSSTQRLAVSKIANSAAANYRQMWTSIWSYQSSVLSCTNRDLCANVDISGNVKSFEAGSARMVELLDQAVLVLRQSTRRRTSGRPLLRSMTTLHRSNLESTSRLPLAQSVCGGQG